MNKYKYTKNINLKRIQLLIQWLIDSEEGGMIEARGYTKTHFSLKGSVSSDDLNLIDLAVNNMLSCIDSRIRISCNMGGIIPYLVKK